MRIAPTYAADNLQVPSTSKTNQSQVSYLRQCKFLLNPIKKVCQHEKSNLYRDTRIEKDVANDKTKSIMMGSISNGNSYEDILLPVSSNEQLQQNNFWPPWPLNLLTQTKKDSPSNDTQDRFQYQSGASIFFRYCRERTKLGVYQLQQVLSDTSWHLPPAAPMILPLAILPYKQGLKSSSTESIASLSISSSPRMLIHKISRSVALTSLSVAVLSWADYEVRKTKRLTPLPLAVNNGNGDVKKAVLPPFLPERIPPPDPLLKNLAKNRIDSTTSNAESVINEASTRDKLDETLVDGNTGKVPKWTKQLISIYDSASKKAQKQLPITFSYTLSQWKLLRSEKKRKIEEEQRDLIFQALIELQSLKQKTKLRKNSQGDSHSKDNNAKTLPLGYALVTGASRGLGRAIAVELARWEIPLVLVARDVEKLKLLADDIENCYNVPAVIIQADLSNPKTAAKLFKTTKEAGINVDILVNNAGICAHGELVDSNEGEIEKVLNLNTLSVSKLAHLYGKEMKRRRRGRILFVSSIVGALPSGPGLATYAATKAFDKSLALSMGKELESYGVGVTCIMPGAIKGTSFTSQSSAGEKAVDKNSLCWKIPFYPKTAPEVASKGVRAILSGDAEVVNGLLNRLVVRVAQPLLPQRLTSMIVETSFKPLRLSLPFAKKAVELKENTFHNEFYESRNDTQSQTFLKKLQSNIKAPSQILTLKEDEENEIPNHVENKNDSDPNQDVEDMPKEDASEESHDAVEGDIDEKEEIERKLAEYEKRLKVQ